MKTRKCDMQTMAAMCSMPSSSKEQNQALQSEIEEGFSLHHCFIKVDDHRNVVCRMVIYEEQAYLGYFTVEDIEQEEVNEFLHDVLVQVDDRKAWCTDIYSDKIHYDKIWNALTMYFKVEVKRESYTIQVNQQRQSLANFQSAALCDKEDVCRLIKEASESTLDRLLQKELCQEDLGKAAEKKYNELLQLKNSNAFFQVLWMNQKAVGYISIEELIKGIGAIAYIGVIPKAQGKHYSTLLLKKAIEIAYEHRIEKLIADIDCKNYAMRYNLIQAGFEKDCNQSIFLIK